MKKKIIRPYDKTLLEHYKKVALNNGSKWSSTIQDEYIRNSELECIKAEIKKIQKSRKKKKLNVLDVGCGNGYVLEVLANDFPDCNFVGIEFSPELYKIAEKRKLSNLEIRHGDCREHDFMSGSMFDFIYTERVIINIMQRKDQYMVVDKIMSLLGKGGKYLMIESFVEPLVELNLALKEMCLEKIKESSHNLYLYEGFIDRLRKLGVRELKTTLAKNYLSTHFYVSRVFHQSIRPKGGKLKFARFPKFFAEALPAGVGNYSPILFRLFSKS